MNNLLHGICIAGVLLYIGFGSLVTLMMEEVKGMRQMVWYRLGGWW